MVVNMKKAVSVVLSLWLALGAITANAAEMKIKSIVDPIEKKVMINGSLSSGPDARVSVTVFDADGNTVFADELLTGAEGTFKTSFDAENFAQGNYRALLKSNDGGESEYEFAVPIKAEDAQKLSLTAENDILLIKDGAPDKDYCEFVLRAENAELAKGKLSDNDFSAEGLPEGYRLEAESVDGKRIVFVLKGSGNVDKTCNVLLTVKSSIISGGKANTGADPVAVTIYPEAVGRKVSLDKYELTACMKDAKNVDSARSTFEVGLTLRDLNKDGLLTEGTDYDFSVPSALVGLKCEAAANKSENKIRIILSGTLRNPLANDETAEFVLKSTCVDGASEDSEKVLITLKKANTGSSSSGGGGSTGGSGGGGYTGGGQTAADITPTVPEKTVSFDDISGHWAENEILKLAGAGYISGVGNNLFVPDRNISRAEFVAMTVKSFGITQGSYNNDFADVAQDEWYAGYIAKALNAGIISEDSLFRPNDPIKREEMVKVIIGAWLMNNGRPEWVNMAQFADKENISAWAADYLDLAVTLGLVKGDNLNNFNPKKSATRAEAAAIFYRLLFLN